MTDEAESSVQTTHLGALVGWHSIMTALTQPTHTFDGTNYSSWSTAFMEFLNAHHLWHHLKDLPPLESDPSYAKWSYLESAVCTWVCQSVDRKIMQPNSTTQLAHALWQRLATVYANKSNMSKKVCLYEESIITNLTVY